MSIAALRAAATLLDTDPADLSSLDRLVLLVLADAANQDGYVWLGSTKLGRRAGLWPSNARRHRAHLVATGYLFPCTVLAGRKSGFRLPIEASALSPTRIRGIRVDDANPHHGDTGPVSGGYGGRITVIHDPGLDPGTDPRADEPAAFTDPDTLAAWLDERRQA